VNNRDKDIKSVTNVEKESAAQVKRTRKRKKMGKKGAYFGIALKR